MSAATRVLELALARPATLGEGRLVCLDGPAGSGKSTLAAQVAALADDAVVVGLDDLYEGWGGLPGVGRQLASLLVPLAAGEAGSYRRWDWHAGAWAETRTVPPSRLLVLEGVGSWSAEHAALVTVLAWVTAPPGVRTARVLGRDGDLAAPYLAAWRADEDRHHAAHGTRPRADLVVAT